MSEATTSKTATRREIDILADVSMGTEIAMLECMLFLHDKGVIDKNELAVRLDNTASRMVKIFDEQGSDGKAVAFASRRMANALRVAVKIDEDGETVV